MKPIFIVLLLINLSSSAQIYNVKKDSLLSYLYASKGYFNDINILNPKSKPYLSIKVANEYPIQKLIKNNKGLFICIDGTGQVFKAISTDKDIMNFAKIDSTIYFGHNYGGIKFSYLDTLYNFGGNGFWHFFGHLSYFTEGKEWDIKKINEEHIVNSNISYFNADKDQLFYIQTPYKDVATNKSFDKRLLFKLNIKTKNNELIGYVNETFLKYDKLTIYFSSKKLDGLLCSYLNDYYLLNFNKNEISRLKNINLIKALDGSINDKTEAIFEKDSLIYLANGNIRVLKAYDFKISDFELINYKIFNRDYSKIYITISIILVVLTFLFLLNFKLIKTKINSLSKKDVFTTDLDFNEVEKALINLLIGKAEKEQHSDVDEVNNVLGLAKKSLDVQKKLRTEHIHRINHKFKVNYNVNINLIERHKTEEDRRFIKYGISKANSIIYKRK
jgi:hypothetical protein